MLQFKNANELFEYAYWLIMHNGLEKAGTKYVNNFAATILNTLDNIITNEKRKWKKDYADIEWQWYLSQDRNVEQLVKHAKIWDKMHNGDYIVNSNYGWQINRNDQLDKVINMLIKEPDTRRAVLSIYDGKEISQYEFDTPCTLSLHFYTSYVNFNRLLNMTVYMRSNDLVYGFCNDQYCFSKILEHVAKMTNSLVGNYTHIATDMHIYKRHFNLI